MDATTHLRASSATDRIREVTGHPRSHSPRQEEILDVLEELFLTKGFQTVTVDELAAAAQCSKKTLYELAPSKGELFVLVLDRMWRRLGEHARATMAHETTALAQIAAFVRNGLSVLKLPWGSLFEDIEAYGPARRLQHDHVDVGIKFMSEIIAAGMDEGEFKRANPRLVAEALAASVVHLSRQTVLDEIGVGAEDAIDQLTQVMLAGLSPSGPKICPSGKKK